MQKRDVAVLILRQAGKILLEKRGGTEKRFPNTWGLFGGGLEKNETALQAITREMQEELGYGLNNPRLLFTYPFTLPEYGEDGVVYVFEDEVDGASPLSLNQNWHSPDKILEGKDFEMHSVYRGIIAKAEKQSIII